MPYRCGERIHNREYTLAVTLLFHAPTKDCANKRADNRQRKYYFFRRIVSEIDDSNIFTLIYAFDEIYSISDPHMGRVQSFCTFFLKIYILCNYISSPSQPPSPPCTSRRLFISRLRSRPSTTIR